MLFSSSISSFIKQQQKNPLLGVHSDYIDRTVYGLCKTYLSPQSTVNIQVDLHNGVTMSCPALVDTGSHVNLISVRKYKELSALGEHKLLRQQAMSDHLIGLGGHSVQIQDCCMLSVRLKHDKPPIPILFHVVRENNLDFILGREFLDQTYAIMNLSNNVLLINWDAALKDAAVNSSLHKNERILYTDTPTNYTLMLPKTKSYVGRNNPLMHSDRNIKKLEREKYVEFVREWYQKHDFIEQNPQQQQATKPLSDKLEWGDLNDPELSKDQVVKLKEMLNGHSSAFVTETRRIGYCDLLPLEIHLKDPHMQPIRQKQYRLNPNVIAQAQSQMDQFLQDGIIEPCDSEWNFPILLLPKGCKRSHKHMKKDHNKPKKYRLITDLRGLNKVMRCDQRLIPNLDTVVDSICSSYKDPNKVPKYWSTLDLTNGYFQLALHENSRKYTAFTWNGDQYRFCRLPQGLSSSAAIFCKVIKRILKPYLGACCLSYMDDVIIFSPDYDTHLKDIANVLEAFAQANLLLSPSKCCFARRKVEFLGMCFTPEGYTPADKHLEAVRTYPEPTTVKELRTFLGLVNYFRKFLKHRSVICAPLYSLTKKDAKLNWTKMSAAMSDNAHLLLLDCMVISSQLNAWRRSIQGLANGILPQELISVHDMSAALNDIASHLESDYPTFKLIHDAEDVQYYYLNDVASAFVRMEAGRLNVIIHVAVPISTHYVPIVLID